MSTAWHLTSNPGWTPTSNWSDGRASANEGLFCFFLSQSEGDGVGGSSVCWLVKPCFYYQLRAQTESLWYWSHTDMYLRGIGTIQMYMYLCGIGTVPISILGGIGTIQVKCNVSLWYWCHSDMYPCGIATIQIVYVLVILVPITCVCLWYWYHSHNYVYESTTSLSFYCLSWGCFWTQLSSQKIAVGQVFESRHAYVLLGLLWLI